jgi:hypothetical protein
MFLSSFQFRAIVLSVGDSVQSALLGCVPFVRILRSFSLAKHADEGCEALLQHRGPHSVARRMLDMQWPPSLIQS